MAIFDAVKSMTKRNAARSGPRLLTEHRAFHLTPNMIRIVFAGPELADFPTGREGGNCKLMFPSPGETKAEFADRLAAKPSPTKRTYTVRKFDPEAGELSIDFVDHGDSGPASGWACRAKPGAFLGFAGPSGPKVTHFEADWYLIACDPSAVPVAAATLEAMPRDAKGVAVFEITSDADREGFEADIDMPAGIAVHWLTHGEPQKPSRAQEDFIRSLDWPEGRVQTCIAGESGVIRALKEVVLKEKALPKGDVYISGYWKIGLNEDAHQQAKRAEG